MIPVLFILTAAYVLFMLFLLYGFHQVKEHEPAPTPPETDFSLIIPYRNEAENLPRLFLSLSQLRYPASLFEILLVNDASTDDSEELAVDFREQHPGLRIRLLHSEHTSASPKKDAVSTGVKTAAGDYILTTDADCTLPVTWLESFDRCIKTTGNKLVAGPVRIRVPENAGYALQFQELDFFSLQSATVGGFGVNLPFMCNAANLCYEKQAFFEVNGYEANNHIASGDDVFLLGKFLQNNLATGFLKDRNAIVSTEAQPNWRTLIAQRIRWAAKTPAYTSLFPKLAGLLVFLINAGLVVTFFSMIFGFTTPMTFFLVFLFKFNVDFILIYSSAKFFDRENSMKNYFWSSLLYPFFSTYVALLSLFTSYTWKDRRFKK